jgi:hypothetical protein
MKDAHGRRQPLNRDQCQAHMPAMGSPEKQEGCKNAATMLGPFNHLCISNLTFNVFLLPSSDFFHFGMLFFYQV